MLRTTSMREKPERYRFMIVNFICLLDPHKVSRHFVKHYFRYVYEGVLDKIDIWITRLSKVVTESNFLEIEFISYLFRNLSSSSKGANQNA